METINGSPADLALLFLERWAAHDMEHVERLLDPEVAFRSPANHCTGRDGMVQAIGPFSQVVTGLDVQVVTASDEHVMVMYDMHTAPFGTIRVAEHFIVKGGLITADELVFDTASMAGTH